MSQDRKTLLRDIKLLQQLIPGEDYALYIKQCQQNNLQYVPSHGFLPAMDENHPKSLNDVELNVLSKARTSYLNNFFIPNIVEKQPDILKRKPEESTQKAIERWTESIKEAKTPGKLKTIIEDINRRRKSTSKSASKKKSSFWRKLMGK